MPTDLSPKQLVDQLVEQRERGQATWLDAITLASQLAQKLELTRKHCTELARTMGGVVKPDDQSRPMGPRFAELALAVKESRAAIKAYNEDKANGVI